MQNAAVCVQRSVAIPEEVSVSVGGRAVVVPKVPRSSVCNAAPAAPKPCSAARNGAGHMCRAFLNRAKHIARVLAGVACVLGLLSIGRKSRQQQRAAKVKSVRAQHT